MLFFCKSEFLCYTTLFIFGIPFYFLIGVVLASFEWKITHRIQMQKPNIQNIGDTKNNHYIKILTFLLFLLLFYKIFFFIDANQLSKTIFSDSFIEWSSLTLLFLIPFLLGKNLSRKILLFSVLAIPIFYLGYYTSPRHGLGSETGILTLMAYISLTFVFLILIHFITGVLTTSKNKIFPIKILGGLSIVVILIIYFTPIHGLEGCFEIDSPIKKISCLENYSPSDPSICNRLKVGSVERDICYELAIHGKNISVCERLNNREMIDECYFYFAFDLRDSSICEKMISNTDSRKTRCHEYTLQFDESNRFY